MKIEINNMKIEINDLKFNKNGDEYSNGYRIVYFYNNTYSIGAYSNTIEGFMLDFIECAPIIDEDDIPKFVSVDDILERSLKMFSDIKGVGIYKIDGTVIKIKDRKLKHKNI